MAEEVERLKGRNAALLDAEAKEAERRARLEAGVATALASFEGEARRARAEAEAAQRLLGEELRASEAQLRGSAAEVEI